MFVNLPNFCQSTDFDASNDRNCDEPSYHNRWLKYIGPHHGFQSALIKKKTKQTNNTNQKKTNVCVIRRFIHMHPADCWFYDGSDHSVPIIYLPDWCKMYKPPRWSG